MRHRGCKGGMIVSGKGACALLTRSRRCFRIVSIWRAAGVFKTPAEATWRCARSDTGLLAAGCGGGWLRAQRSDQRAIAHRKGGSNDQGVCFSTCTAGCVALYLRLCLIYPARRSTAGFLPIHIHCKPILNLPSTAPFAIHEEVLCGGSDRHLCEC